MLRLKMFAGLALAMLALCAAPILAQDTEKKPPDKVQILIGKLTDKRVCVAAQAAGLLGDAKDTRAVDPLITMLKSDQTDLRCVAAYALASIGDKRAIAPLIELLDDEDEGTKAAIDALATLKAKEAVKPLIELLEKPDFDYRAIDALGRIGDPSAIDALLKRGIDANFWVDALQSIGAPAVGPLIEVLKSRDEIKSCAAARALYLIADPSAVEPLVAMLGQAKYEECRSQVIDCLSSIDDPRATHAIAGILLDPSAETSFRARAAAAYGGMMAPDAFQILAPLVKSTDEELRHSALTGLACSGDPRGVRLSLQAELAAPPDPESEDDTGGHPWLLFAEDADDKVFDGWAPLLNDKDPAIRRAVLETLADACYDNGQLLPTITEAARDPNVDIRRAAAGWLLTNQGINSKVLEVFGGFCEDPDDDLRSEIVTDLCAYEADSVDAALARFASDKLPHIRLAVIRRLPPAKHLTLLISALRDSEPGVRRAAAERLASTDSPRAVAPLRRLLRDKDPDVRFSALCSLVSFGDYSKIPQVLAAFQGESQYAMRRAYSCIAEIADPKAVVWLRPYLKDENLHYLVALATARSQDHEGVQDLVKMLQESITATRSEIAMAQAESQKPKTPAEPPSEEPTVEESGSGDYSDDGITDEDTSEECIGDAESADESSSDTAASGDEAVPSGEEDVPQDKEADLLADEMSEDESGDCDPSEVDVVRIIQAFAICRDSTAAKPLLDLVGADDLWYSGEAVTALGVMKDKSIVADAIKLLDKDRAQTRWSVAWLLAQLDDDRARAALQNGLNEWDVQVVGGGATYFIGIGSAQAIPVIADALSVLERGYYGEPERHLCYDEDLIDGCAASGNRELTKIIKHWMEDGRIKALFGGDASWGSAYPKWGTPVPGQPGIKSKTAKTQRLICGDELHEIGR